MKPILLSVPHMAGSEWGFVREAFETNWLSTVGPHIDAFEREFSGWLGLPSVAVSSGTAAIHLGLRLLGVKPGDEVFCSTLTFVASANPICYLGAAPVFIDSNHSTWTMDPDLLARALHERARRGKLPRAIVVVHLYGQCADMASILEACARYEVPVLEDAAEALGASYRGRRAGVMGAVAAFSFNGNKIITTTGGGMLVSADSAWIAKSRYWSTQARNPGPVYDHSEIGNNYRLSNVLAGIGRGQLQVLELRVQQRRAIARRYREALSDVPGLDPMPEAAYGVPTNWLSCFVVDEHRFGRSRDELICALGAAQIESRPVWKPMHLQPLYDRAERYGGEVAEDLFRRGICLPSSSSLTAEEQLCVINEIRTVAGLSAAGGVFVLSGSG